MALPALCKRTVLRSLAIVASFLSLAAAGAQPPIDADWKANARIDNLRVVSDERLGAAQGVSYRQDRLYFYGDVDSAKPRVGIIREYASSTSSRPAATSASRATASR